jgi:ABC-2 type transport system ATP-binding protein
MLNTTAEMSRPLITIQHVSKCYGSVQALRDFSLEIPCGTTYGLIGPNGAGKTTLMRILAAVIAPNSGQVWFGDHEVSQAPTIIQRKIGYMPDIFGVYPDLTCIEYLQFYAGIHGISRHKRTGIINDLLELVDLSTKRDELVEVLSRGMKQRLCLARTLVHDPEVLILDEPASGLDPRGHIELRELVRTLQSIGKTIIISSHMLFELAEMCTHVAILQEGQLAIAGNIETVIQQDQGKRQLEIHILGQERLDDTIALLTNMPMISKVTFDEKKGILADFTGHEQALHSILADLLSHNIPVFSFAPRIDGSCLEDIFMHIIERGEQE